MAIIINIDVMLAKRKMSVTELTEKGQDTTLEEVLANLQKRDRIDSTRVDSPLKKADDAIELDNSAMTREEQFDWVMDKVNKKLGSTL